MSRLYWAVAAVVCCLAYVALWWRQESVRVAVVCRQCALSGIPQWGATVTTVETLQAASHSHVVVLADRDVAVDWTWSRALQLIVTELDGQPACTIVDWTDQSHGQVNLWHLYLHGIETRLPPVIAFQPSKCPALMAVAVSETSPIKDLLLAAMSHRVPPRLARLPFPLTTAVRTGRIEPLLRPQLTPLQLVRVKRLSQPAVTVIVPFYDMRRADWLTAALDSLRDQTWQDFEVLVVDDGSRDELALAVLHTTLSQFSEDLAVRLITRRVNGGLAAARNTGAIGAMAPLILFLDPDDMVAPNALEQLLAVGIVSLLPQPQLVAHSNDRRHGFVYSGVKHLFDDKEEGDGGRVVETFAPFSAARLKSENYLTSTALISRQMFMQIGGMCQREIIGYFEDWEFWCRAVSLGFVGEGLLEPLFVYRRHQSGQSARLFAKSRQDGGNGATAPYQDELERHCPVLFGRLAKSEVTAVLEYRHHRSDTGKQHDGDFLHQLAADPNYLACYRPVVDSECASYNDARLFYHSTEPTQSSSMKHHDKFTIVPAFSGRQQMTTVLYFIPWTVVGGADYYDLQVIKVLRQSIPGVSIILLLERHIPLHLQTLRHEFAEQVDEVVTLQAISNNSRVHDLFIDNLIVSRNVTLVVLRSVVAGYRFVGRYMRWRQGKFNQDPLPDGLGQYLPVQLEHLLESTKRKLKIVDILHLYTDGDTSGWEWRSGKVAAGLNARIVVSQDLKDYLINRVGNGQASQVQVVNDDELVSSFAPVDEAKIVVIHPPANIPDLSHATVANGDDPVTTGKSRLFFLGRMEWQKDPFLWVETAKQLDSSQIDFIMHGTGSLTPSIKQHVRGTNVVLQESAVSQAALSSVLLTQSGYQSILMVTSRFDGLSMMIIEALSMGVPVVALDCTRHTGGGLHEITGAGNWLLLVEAVVTGDKYSNNSFEGSQCNIDYPPTARALAAAVDTMRQRMVTDELSAFRSWQRRYMELEAVRQKFGVATFQNSVEALIEGLLEDN